MGEEIANSQKETFDFDPNESHLNQIVIVIAETVNLVNVL